MAEAKKSHGKLPDHASTTNASDQKISLERQKTFAAKTEAAEEEVAAASVKRAHSVEGSGEAKGTGHHGDHESKASAKGNNNIENMNMRMLFYCFVSILFIVIDC
jgi:hypothetical protein